MLCPFRKQLEKESPWKGEQGLGAALGSCGSVLGRRCKGWLEESYHETARLQPTETAAAQRGCQQNLEIAK